MYQIWLILLAWLPALGLYQPQGIVATQPVTVTPQVEYVFGSQIVITATVQTTQTIQNIQINFQKDGPISIPGGDMTLVDQAGVYIVDLKKTPIQAFSTVTYHFNVTLENSPSQQSPDFSFFYEDNRYTWNLEDAGPFHVHWYDTNPDTGRMVLELAQTALDNSQQWFVAPEPPRVDIYVYNNTLDLQSTLLMGNLRWAAGHADPEMGLIVVALPPGPDQHILAEQRIPHELTHILLYQQMQKSYTNLPAWLSEGLASVAEQQPNPDYDTILKYANEKDAFIPFERLCQNFPTDANSAFLAYAQSEWFTRYLYQHYGEAKMQDLLNEYTQGADCKAAPVTALGMSLSDLQDQWLSDQFGRNIILKGLGTMLPWLFLVIVVLILPFGWLARRPRKVGKTKRDASTSTP